MEARYGIVQLCRHADGASRSTYTAFKDGTDVQLVCDGSDVGVFPLEGKRRCACRDLQFVDSRERVDELFRQSVREELLILVATEVHERQHRDRMRRRLKSEDRSHVRLWNSFPGGELFGGDRPRAAPGPQPIDEETTKYCRKCGGAHQCQPPSGAGAKRSTRLVSRRPGYPLIGGGRGLWG